MHCVDDVVMSAAICMVCHNLISNTSINQFCIHFNFLAVFQIVGSYVTLPPATLFLSVTTVSLCH